MAIGPFNVCQSVKYILSLVFMNWFENHTTTISWITICLDSLNYTCLLIFLCSKCLCLSLLLVLWPIHTYQPLDFVIGAFQSLFLCFLIVARKQFTRHSLDQTTSSLELILYISEAHLRVGWLGDFNRFRWWHLSWLHNFDTRCGGADFRSRFPRQCRRFIALWTTMLVTALISKEPVEFLTQSLHLLFQSKVDLTDTLVEPA